MQQAAAACSSNAPRHFLLCAGEYTAAALAWLESGGRADVAQLVQQLVPARMSEVTIQRPAAPAPAPA